MEIASLRVDLIAQSHCDIPADLPWRAEENSGTQQLIEFASRIGEGSLQHRNPRTNESDTYIRTLIELGGNEFLRHAYATVYLQGISFGTAYSLRKNRDFHITEAEPAAARSGKTRIVIPEVCRTDPELQNIISAARDDYVFLSQEIATLLDSRQALQEHRLIRERMTASGVSAVELLCQETPLIITGNIAVWREFIQDYGGEYADPDLRAVAIAVLKLFQSESPLLWSDFVISKDSEENSIAYQPY